MSEVVYHVQRSRSVDCMPTATKPTTEPIELYVVTQDITNNLFVMNDLAIFLFNTGVSLR